MSAGGRVLLVSDTRLTDPGGRAERFRTRRDSLQEHGWELVVGFVPKPYIFGFPAAVVRLTRLARREDVDVVNSVNNPFHLHAVGFVVALFAGAKWLAECRDPLVTNPELADDPLMPLRRFVEWLVVHGADRVVWGDGIQLPEDYFAETYGSAGEDVDRLPFAGYVADVFEEAEPVEYDDFTITYAGSFYEGWLEPHRFLEGLGKYVDRRTDGTDGLTVQFYGDWIPEYQHTAEAFGVADCVEHHEVVPHDEIVAVLEGSDVLLYIGGTDPSNRRSVPSKVMDYIGARRPILVLADQSFRVAELVEDNQLGVVADPRDPDAVASALERLEAGGVAFTNDEATFERFTRDRKNQALVAVLDDLVDS